jgi:hypothetical protein
MDEIAAVSIGAEALLKESHADLCLIFAVHLIVFLELVEPVCEFASFLVGAVAILDEFFAELGFLLVGMRVLRALSGGLLGGEGVAELLGGVEEGGDLGGGLVCLPHAFFLCLGINNKINNSFLLIVEKD